MFRTINPRNFRGDVTVMLKEVQVTPGHLLEIMGTAELPADRAGILGSSLGADNKSKLMRRFARVKYLPSDFPWLLKSKPKDHYLVAVHDYTSCEILCGFDSYL